MFEAQIFQEKYDQIQVASQNADLVCQNIQQTRTVIGQTIQDEKAALDQLSVTTKEQRALLSEIKLSISRNERKYLKGCNQIDAQLNNRNFVTQKEQLCEEIVLKHKSVDAKNMIQ